MFEPAFLGQVLLHGTQFHLAGPSLGQEYWPEASRRALEKFERAQEEGAGDEELGVLWEAYQATLQVERDWLKRVFPFRSSYPGVSTPPPPPPLTTPPPPPPPSRERPITREMRPDVPSVDCSYMGPYAYFDGRQCRSSNMTASAGGLINQAMNFGPSGGGGGMVSPGNLDFNPGSFAATSFMGRRSLGQEAPGTFTYKVQVVDRDGKPMNNISVLLKDAYRFEGRSPDMRSDTDITGIATFEVPMKYNYANVGAFLPEGYTSSETQVGETKPMFVIRSSSTVPTPAQSAVTPAEAIGGVGGIAALIAGLMTSGNLGKGLIAAGSVATGVSIYSAMMRK